MQKTIALIPARSGSTRIPNKNVREFFGRPIIAWSIECALRSSLFQHVYVSTDDPAIAEVASAAGAEVPFMRPGELADEHTGVIPVMRHGLERIKEAGTEVDEACLIYATAPFMRPEDVRRGRDLLREKRCDYVMPVTDFPSPIQRALKMDPNGRVEMFERENFSKRSQDLETAYRDAAQFCWGTAAAWLEERLPYEANTYPVHVPRYLVQDIDTVEDWENAEWMFRSLRSGGMV